MAWRCKIGSLRRSFEITRWAHTYRSIDKLLIANRGEIACRIMKTARKLGVKTVAVYSEADANSKHVQMADEAYCIGPPSSQQSYLRGDKIIEVAKKTHSQAIHPGYGFLSENAEFSELCEKSGVVFVGPPPSAIRNMGIKSTSKEIMSSAGVPVIKGYHGENQDSSFLKAEAAKIGYPVMIKAVRGGGGKGMRIALTESEFIESLESARSESQKSFGDSVVLLEQFVQEPRHIEVQVFADKYGNTVYLYERDCSVQRRHQKIIEEAPAPGISEATRSELGLAAVRAAKAVGYVGAGTVEFILDCKTGKFFFMEMNTRLQVEHPITEMITGTDLVEWQLKVAAGEELPLTQDQIKLNGHAFEARIYAENPENNFLPGAGVLDYLVAPLTSHKCRVETGVGQGDEVSVHYDPMIAKLVVWDQNRADALKQIKSKLADFNIAGLETNINFLLSLCNHQEFALGNVHTNFIRDHYESLFKKHELTQDIRIRAALAVAFSDNLNQTSLNPFVVEGSFRVNYEDVRAINLKFKDEDVKALVKWFDAKTVQVSLDDGKTWSQAVGEVEKVEGRFLLNCKINNSSSRTTIYRNDDIVALYFDNGKYEFQLEQPKFLTEELESLGLSRNVAVAPMPGVIDKILVKVGDVVKKGEPLVVLIAMKMEFIVKATKEVEISEVLFKVGDSVPKDSVLVQFKV